MGWNRNEAVAGKIGKLWVFKELAKEKELV